MSTGHEEVYPSSICMKVWSPISCESSTINEPKPSLEVSFRHVIHPAATANWTGPKRTKPISSSVRPSVRRQIGVKSQIQPTPSLQPPRVGTQSQ